MVFTHEHDQTDRDSNEGGTDVIREDRVMIKGDRYRIRQTGIGSGRQGYNFVATQL